MTTLRVVLQEIDLVRSHASGPSTGGTKTVSTSEGLNFDEESQTIYTVKSKQQPPAVNIWEEEDAVVVCLCISY